MNNIFRDLKNLKERWASINIGEVNATPVAARVMEDVEAEFHTHEQADEFFMVLSGKIFIDTDHASIELSEGQSYTVRSGTRHRARVVGRAELIVVGGQNA